METIVIVIMMLVGFNFLLKHSFLGLRAVLVMAVVAAAFVGFMWPYAIEQSKTQLSIWLANSKLMLDLSVILTVDVAIEMAFCMMAAHVMTSGRLKRRTIYIYKVLRWFPGLLIFPVLFTCLVWLIFSMPGRSFAAVAWAMAAGVMVATPLGAWLLRWLLPEKDLRLEILFLTNALTAILGIIATVNGRTAVAGVSHVDWTALAALAILLIIGGIIGFILFKNKKIKIRI